MRHRFHAICPYFAMFPESFPERWLSLLTKPGDTVLDPFSGRGTTAFQAVLMNRKAVANDINPVAFCVTKAKVEAASRDSVVARLERLEAQFRSLSLEVTADLEPNAEFFRMAYHAGTLRELLFLRSELNWRDSAPDTMLAAIILGILHGETDRSSRYLSSQMPRTISTKPAYSVRWWQARGSMPPIRDVFATLRREVEFRYATGVPSGQATVVLGDMRELHRRRADFPGPVRCVITSPPYFDTTSFEEDQWLRLWFLGGPPHPSRGRVSPDDRLVDRSRYWGMMLDFWRMLSGVLDDSADVVVRLGGKDTRPQEVVAQLEASAAITRRKVTLAHSETSLIARRQTNAFRPGSAGVKFEVDCHFRFE